MQLDDRFKAVLTDPRFQVSTGEEEREKEREREEIKRMKKRPSKFVLELFP